MEVSQGENPLIFSNISVDVHALPDVSKVMFEKVSQKYLTIQWSLTVLMSIAFGGILYSILFSIPEMESFAWIIAMVGGLLFAILRGVLVALAFPWKGYALRSHDVIYRTGLLWRKVIVIPFSRIQHGELSEGLLDRPFGLAKIRLYTAGGSSSDLSIPALEKERAEKLRDYIMKRVVEESSEDIDPSELTVN